MQKYIRYILLILIIYNCTFFPSEAFSQNNEQQNNGYVKGITAGRARALAGGILALISLIIAARAKARNKRTSAIVALLLGLIAIFLSVIHLITSAGAVFGSGSGKAGAIVGLVVGLLGIIFSGMALRGKKV